MDRTPTLHVFGQYDSHQPAKIVGTREALEQLHRALSRIVGETKSYNHTTSTFAPSDREDYLLTIIMVPNDGAEELDRLPYTSPVWDKESV